MSKDFFGSPISKEILFLIMGFILIASMPLQLASFQAKEGPDSMSVGQLSNAVEGAEQSRSVLDKEKVWVSQRIAQLDEEILVLVNEAKREKGLIKQLGENLKNAEGGDISEIGRRIEKAKKDRTQLLAIIEQMNGLLKKGGGKLRAKSEERRTLLAKLGEKKDALEKAEIEVAKLAKEAEKGNRLVMRKVPVGESTKKGGFFVDIAGDRAIPMDEAHYEQHLNQRYEMRPDGMYKVTYVEKITRKATSEGETESQITSYASEYRRALRGLDSEKKYIVFILREGASFSAFRAARDIAAKAGFQSGWEPMPGEDDGTLNFSGSGRSIPSQ